MADAPNGNQGPRIGIDMRRYHDRWRRERTRDRPGQVERAHRAGRDATMSEPGLQFTPDNLEIVFLSFEGSDQPYSQAGGLGVRVSNPTRALARAGLAIHLFSVGEPDLPDYEAQEDGQLYLRRWPQWVSACHRADVYDGEIERVHDY